MPDYKELKKKSYAPDVSDRERASEDKKKVSRMKSPKLTGKLLMICKPLRLQMYAETEEKLYSMRDQLMRDKKLLPSDFDYIGRK